MNRLEAVKAILQGKKVTHPHNEPGSYYYLGESDILFYHESTVNGNTKRMAMLTNSDGYEILKTKVKKSGEFFISDRLLEELNTSNFYDIGLALSRCKSKYFKNPITVTWEEEE